MMRLALALAILLAAPAGAETRMTADDFDAFATGKTLTYRSASGVFGTEEYLPGRKVRWSDGSAGCYSGLWYPKGEDICFYYQGVDEPACWRFLRTDDKVIADFSGDAETLFLDVVASKDKLPCNGLKANE
ncbi:MAG: hypothetical protein ACK47C_15390 [Paracoccaceae bacterium]